LSLIKYQPFTSHSGLNLSWKIDCDSLFDKSIEAIAEIVKDQYDFREVYGIPRGGIRLANALKKYENPGSLNLLIVDDVMTTGKSMQSTKESFMEKYKWGYRISGFVMFDRCSLNFDWIDHLFKVNDDMEKF
jgi:orotate phosphoribosyltransferase